MRPTSNHLKTVPATETWTSVLFFEDSRSVSVSSGSNWLKFRINCCEIRENSVNNSIVESRDDRLRGPTLPGLKSLHCHGRGLISDVKTVSHPQPRYSCQMEQMNYLSRNRGMQSHLAEKKNITFFTRITTKTYKFFQPCAKTFFCGSFVLSD